MKTVNIYLLRHGKTLGEPALNGHTDVEVAPLTQQSICRDIRSRFPSLENVVTSPLKRCLEVGQGLINNNSALTLRIDAAFKEMNFGQFDGVPFDHLTQHWDVLERFWQDPAHHPLPGAEPLDAFYSRVSDGWDALTSQLTQDTLLIAHGGTIRMILARVLGLDWRNPALFSILQIGNQSISHIKMTHSEQMYTQVCSIGSPLSIE
ncbi:histidine phosphatase family protein [Vibrio renipiscarius]|uniref:histidine phosphatase family protein n=1 Tax=Vibrio renipiscarius TaxID=1461322 RepID=UPI003553F6F7